MPKRTYLQRPIISEPIGPVKSSRGPDLTRSEKFEVVGGINDCGSSASNPSDSIASRKSRRISASFLNTEPPSSSPTVVGSEVSAVSRMQGKYSSKESLGRKAGLFSLSTRSLLKQSSKYTLVARLESDEDTKNIPPFYRQQDEKKSAIPRSMSKLPKSRTMMVLHELKKSFSRPSLAAVRSINSSYKQSPQNHPVFGKFDNSEPSISTSPSSQTTLTSFSLLERCPTPPPVPSIRHIGTAQSSEYWSGRFMALQDRFSSENLTKASLSSSSSKIEDRWQTRLPVSGRQSLTTSQNRLTYLAPSNTTSALTTITYNPRLRPPEDGEDVKCKRIFSHLESLCTTSEAKLSLHSWQQAYARRHKRPRLLPEGGCMHEKGRKNGILAGVGNRFKSSERRGHSTFKELTNSRSGAMGITPGRGVTVY